MTKSLDRQLLEAVELGQTERVAGLFAQGANIESKDSLGMRPLHLAVAQGDLNLVRWLLEVGANVDAKSKNGSTPLYLHLEFGRDQLLPLAQLLIAAGADVNYKRSKRNWSMLHWAVDREDIALVNLLITSRADLMEAENTEQATPLHLARNLDVAQRLLAAGADVNAVDKRGNTPLLSVINAVSGEYSKSEMVALAAYLIDAGADVNVSGEMGWTPLHAAISVEMFDLVPKLIAAGADLEAAHRDMGTPLHQAASHGLEAVVRQLIEAGASVNSAQSPDGWMPLHYAAVSGSVKVTKMLIENGADVNALNERGEPPVKWANNESVKQLLQEAGSN